MEKREPTYIPKARTQELVCQSLDDEVLIYDLKHHKAHCLNRTAHLIFQTCDGTKTVSEIKRILTPQLGAQVPEEMVWMALDRLGKARLLEEAPVVTSGTNLVRRDALRKLGIATVIALPIVASIVAPVSAQAESCGRVGVACTMNSQCCSNMCNTSNMCDP
jgi:hypothetical protein